MSWYFAVLKKYAVFSGRARRKEYWFFILFNCIIGAVLGGLFGILLGMGARTRFEAGGWGHMALVLTGYYFFVLNYLYSLAILVPSIAVAVRRLHDIDLSGWWLLIGLIPILGGLALLVLFVLDSTPGDNRFGSNPKGVDGVIAQPIIQSGLSEQPPLG